MAPNHVAGIHISAPRKVPRQEIIKVSKEGITRLGNKPKSIPINRPAECMTSPKLPILSQSVSSMIVTFTLQITKIIRNKNMTKLRKYFFRRVSITVSIFKI